MFELVFMRLALVASIATGLSLGVMGLYLVIRRVVFLGLVIASAATLGATVAEIVGWPAQFLSPAAAVGTAAALGGVHISNRMSAESAMGWAYAATSSVTVLLLSRVAGHSAGASHLLFGNVLAVDTTRVATVTVIALIVVSIQVLFGRRLLLVTFDPEAAMVAGVNTRLWSWILNLAVGVAAAAAVQAIGALSTFALLTLPAMTALLATASVRGAFVGAAALGVTLPSVALATSYYLDLPAGPVSVALLAAGVPIAAMINSVRRGALHSRVSPPPPHAASRRWPGNRCRRRARSRTGEESNDRSCSACPRHSYSRAVVATATSKALGGESVYETELRKRGLGWR